MVGAFQHDDLYATLVNTKKINQYLTGLSRLHDLQDGVFQSVVNERSGCGLHVLLHQGTGQSGGAKKSCSFVCKNKRLNNSENSAMQHKRNKRSTFSADLTVIELSEQLGLQVLVSEYPEQNAGQESAVLSTNVGQSVDHMQLLQQNQL